MGRVCHCRLCQPAPCPAWDGHSPPHHTLPFGLLDWEEEEEEQEGEEEQEEEQEGEQEGEEQERRRSRREGGARGAGGRLITCKTGAVFWDSHTEYFG